MTSMAVLEQRLAGSGRPRPKAPPRTIPPGLGEFRAGQPVLGFDASLNNVGWLLLEVAGGQVQVHCMDTIRPKTQLTGFLGTWDKTRQLTDHLTAVAWRTTFSRPGVRVALEAPSVGGGHRTESSLMAGYKVYETFPGAVTVVATHVSWVLTGNARLASDDRKREVRRLLPALIPGSDGRPWNEHLRDAAAVALTHLWDLSDPAETIDLDKRR